MKQAIILFFLLTATVTATGCSTVAGAGKDLTSAAEWSKEKIGEAL
jgi:predicted small secreted protein